MSHRQDVEPELVEAVREPIADDLWPAADVGGPGRHAGAVNGAETGLTDERAPGDEPAEAAGWASFGEVTTAQQIDDTYGVRKPWLEDLIAEAAAPVVAPPTPLPDPTVERVEAAPVAAPVELPEPPADRTAPLDRIEPGAVVAAPPGPGPDPAPEPQPQPRPSGPTDPEASVPERVAYRPRSARRPVLAALFLLAALAAAAAVAWAVSRGSAATTGIAVGVTGFTLAFLWVLLSWTPIVVTVEGARLGVSRGRDSETFDLRDPRLVVDLDTQSPVWSCTLTRPNGTELVIPASSVDREEFAAIVRHHRAHLHP